MAWILSIGTLTFERVADAIFSQIREAAQTNTVVTFHLLETIGSILAFSKDNVVRRVLLGHAERLMQGSQKNLSLEADQQAIQRRYKEML